MSITVNIYYTGKNKNAQKFAREMIDSGTVEAIRNEPGNIKYEYFLPLNDDETVLLIDSWRDKESIDAHHATEMMNTIATLREKYDLHMKIERYIDDESDYTSSDKSFIRE